MKFVKYTFFVLVLAFLGFFVFYFYPRTAIITGFAAHSVCSCHFNSGRSLASIEANDNNIDIISFADNVIDEESKSVTSSIFGLRKRTAIYQKGYGCVLLGQDGEKPKSIKQQPPKLPLNDTMFWPYGKIETNSSSLEIKKSIQTAFDAKNEKTKMTRAVVVVHKGKIIAEQYAEGFDKDTPQLGWSMTKSIINALYGIQTLKGRVDIDKPIDVPQWKGDARENITYSHLLQMNSGLEWTEDYGSISDATKMLFKAHDVSSVQLNKPLEFPTQTHWEYSSGTTNLLAGLLQNQFGTKQEYLDFPYHALFNKLGMNSMVMETDLTGHYIGSSYGWATPRDWAKFGLLYLQDGVWNRERILPKGWVSYSTAPAKDSKGTYGAQFWLNASGEYPNSPKDMYYCDGYQGQYVYILPTQELVIVRMGLLAYPEFAADDLISKIVQLVQ